MNKSKKPKLIPCSCGSTPTIHKGYLFWCNQSVWWVECNKCESNPSTGNLLTKRAAIKAWNGGVVSESLFKGG